MLYFIQQTSTKLGHFRLKDESQTTSSSLGPGAYFKNRDKEKEAPPLTGRYGLID